MLIFHFPRQMVAICFTAFQKFLPKSGILFEFMIISALRAWWNCLTLRFPIHCFYSRCHGYIFSSFSLCRFLVGTLLWLFRIQNRHSVCSGFILRQLPVCYQHLLVQLLYIITMRTFWSDNTHTNYTFVLEEVMNRFQWLTNSEEITVNCFTCASHYKNSYLICYRVIKISSFK